MPLSGRSMSMLIQILCKKKKKTYLNCKAVLVSLPKPIDSMKGDFLRFQLCAKKEKSFTHAAA